ncbi:PIG-L family deacetylase [soil metagenome]
MDDAEGPPLEAVPEDWDRALAVVAHPDDMEYRASGAVARWTDQGKEVAYLLVTAGEAGIDSMQPWEARSLRAEEQRVACAAVGVTDLVILEHPDGMLVPRLDLRRDIARTIRRVRPELVITLNHRDTFGPGALNMADHIVAGQATIDAVRDAANRWVFRELAEIDGFEPWGGVRWVAVSGSPQPTHAVDVSDSIDRAVASLAAHRVYLDGLGGGPMTDPDSFLRSMSDHVAARFGGIPCTTFELLSM